MIALPIAAKFIILCQSFVVSWGKICHSISNDSRLKSCEWVPLSGKAPRLMIMYMSFICAFPYIFSFSVFTVLLHRPHFYKNTLAWDFSPQVFPSKVLFSLIFLVKQKSPLFVFSSADPQRTAYSEVPSPKWQPIHGLAVHCRLGRLLDLNPRLRFIIWCRYQWAITAP